MDVDHKVRKNVKKARRSGVSVELETEGARLDDFLRLYEHTLDRREAPERYRFSRTFFESIHAQLSGQFVYAHALRDERVVSSELALVSERRLLVPRRDPERRVRATTQRPAEVRADPLGESRR